MNRLKKVSSALLSFLGVILSSIGSLSATLLFLEVAPSAVVIWSAVLWGQYQEPWQTFLTLADGGVPEPCPPSTSQCRPLAAVAGALTWIKALTSHCIITGQTGQADKVVDALLSLMRSFEPQDVPCRRLCYFCKQQRRCCWGWCYRQLQQRCYHGVHSVILSWRGPFRGRYADNSPIAW